MRVYVSGGNESLSKTTGDRSDRFCYFCLLLLATIASSFHSAHAKNNSNVGFATLTVAAVGDVMLGTDYPHDRLPAYNMDNVFEWVANSLLDADIAIANLEGVIMDQKIAPQKKCKDKSKCHAFRAPAHYAQYLRYAGFNAISLANNHSHDFGLPGFQETKKNLAAQGIKSSGGIGDIAIWPDRGVRTAMAAFSTYAYTNNMNNVEKASELVAQLDKFYDVVIVSFHGGSEGLETSHLPFTSEYFHGENRGDVVGFSRAMIDAGADLVIGHGPHVPRAVEVYKKRLIAYSLGNFFTHEGIRINNKFSYAPILLATLNNNGEFLCGRILSARQSRNLGLAFDTDQRAYEEIKKLTEQDLAGGRLRFYDNGRIGNENDANNGCQ